MTVHSPYAPPRSPVSDPTGPASTGLRWQRALGWGLLLYVAVNLLAFAFGLSSGWEIYGANIEEASANARVLRRVATAILGLALYLRFLRGIAARPALHLALMYLGYKAIDIAVSMLVFGNALAGVLAPKALVTMAAVALAALGVDWLRRRRKRTVRTA